MVLVLESREQFDELLMLDTSSGLERLVSRGTESVPEICQGHFVRSNESYACLYRWNDNLLFRHDKVDFIIPSGAVATIEELSNSNVLRIFFSDNEICSWIYQKAHTDFIDYLRYVDDEDMDFGLFILNVINDKNRQDRIYR